jgi:hypothetical protein
MPIATTWLQLQPIIENKLKIEGEAQPKHTFSPTPKNSVHSEYEFPISLTSLNLYLHRQTFIIHHSRHICCLDSVILIHSYHIC